MTKKLYFDMDGTVADLYNYPHWLELLRGEDITPYEQAKPLHNMEVLQAICELLISKGWEIGVITWLSKGASDEYNKTTTEVKRLWVEKYMPYVTEFYPQTYGTPKYRAIKGKPKKAVLVDDNMSVRLSWDTPIQRKSINPTEHLFEKLLELVEE